MSHQPGTIYRQQPTSTGQLMIVSTGAAIRDQSVVVSTAAGTIKNHGLSVLAPSAATVFTLQAPALGCRKEILTYSTLVLKVKTASTGHKINGSTATKVYAISATTKLIKQGVMIKLIGASTVAWYGVVTGQSTLKTPVTLTSAT